MHILGAITKPTLEGVPRRETEAESSPTSYSRLIIEGWSLNFQTNFSATNSHPRMRDGPGQTGTALPLPILVSRVQPCLLLDPLVPLSWPSPLLAPAWEALAA